MKTLICPTCNCSLVRLGITPEKAATYSHNGEKLYFCCQGCADVFITSTDPQKYSDVSTSWRPSSTHGINSDTVGCTSTTSR